MSLLPSLPSSRRHARRTPSAAPELPGVRTAESPIDHAITWMLAGEIDAALRWAAAALEQSPTPAALILTSRLLDQMGRSRAAADGLELAVRQAVDAGDLPLALVAIGDLRAARVDVRALLDDVAGAFCHGSSRLQAPGTSTPRLPAAEADFVQPLSPFLAGPALASKATQILQDAKRAYDESVGADPPPVPAFPLFSALSREALRDLLGTFQTRTVRAGARIVQEGSEGEAAFLVARGEVEVSRQAAHLDGGHTLALARLGGGAFFGEMALLSALPSPTSATATRPTILLVATREALVALAGRRAEVSSQLAAHCRRNSLANLGWASPVVAAVPPEDQASLVEGLEICIFAKGDRLVRDGEDVDGLHLVVSGEVAIVAHEYSERVLLATLGAGETVGEMELVLCRRAAADAVALRPTATLFLSRGEYSLLVDEHPAILHGLYSLAVQRHNETALALQSGSATVADDWLLAPDAPEAETAEVPRLPVLSPTPPATTPPPLPARAGRPPSPIVPPSAVAPPSAPPTAATLRPSLVAGAEGRFSGAWFTLGGVAGGAAAVLAILAIVGRTPWAGLVAASSPPAPQAAAITAPTAPQPSSAPIVAQAAATPFPSDAPAAAASASRVSEPPPTAPSAPASRDAVASKPPPPRPQAPRQPTATLAPPTPSKPAVPLAPAAASASVPASVSASTAPTPPGVVASSGQPTAVGGEDFGGRH